MLRLFDWLHVSVYLFVGGNHVIVGGLGLVDLLLSSSSSCIVVVTVAAAAVAAAADVAAGGGAGRVTVTHGCVSKVLVSYALCLISGTSVIWIGPQCYRQRQECCNKKNDSFFFPGFPY